jgi:hypothetical protein
LDPFGALAAPERRKMRLHLASSILEKVGMKARLGVLVVVGLAGGAIAGVARRLHAGGQSHRNGQASNGLDIVLSQAQADDLVDHLDAAKPPVGAARERRLRELVERGSRLAPDTRPKVRA